MAKFKVTEVLKGAVRLVDMEQLHKGLMWKGRHTRFWPSTTRPAAESEEDVIEWNEDDKLWVECETMSRMMTPCMIKKKPKIEEEP